MRNERIPMTGNAMADKRRRSVRDWDPQGREDERGRVIRFSKMAKNSHLNWKMPERETGLRNT